MRNLLLSLMLVGLFGCATAQLPDDASNAEKQAALCMDAQVAISTADAALANLQVLEPDAIVYWQLFKYGAQQAMQIYCVTK